jgi:hypothetical protein
MNAKRKAVQDVVSRIMKILDKTGDNAEKYAKKFGAMSDGEFASWAKKFLADPDAHFFLVVIPFESEPTLGEIRKAAAALGIPLEERVVMRHDGHAGDPVETAVPCPVGYVIMKRLQQVLEKKNTYSLDIDKRDAMLGQVTGDDRIARVSDTENYALTVMGADATLREFLGPRSDNRAKKQKMYQDIYSNGYTMQRDMKSNPEDSQALSAADVFFLGAGLKTDLITPGMALPRTLKSLDKGQGMSRGMMKK